MAGIDLAAFAKAAPASVRINPEWLQRSENCSAALRYNEFLWAASLDNDFKIPGSGNNRAGEAFEIAGNR